MTATLATETAR